MLPAAPPEHAEPFEACIADLDTVVAPNLTHWQHPRFFGYFPANALLAGVLGDLVSTGLGTIGLSWQSGPALTEVEEVVTDWVRQMVGLSAGWVGVISDTASTSTLVALISARERTTGYSLARGGLHGEPAPLVVYASAGSHSCVAKGALLAGIGPVAEIARKHGLWLHVDAAMAGSAMILPECRWMWDGIEGADSIVINAHKWLGAPFDCTLYYVRDEQHLQRVMSTNPSFLQSAVDGQVRNLRDTGIPLGRRFRALKLWFLIREQGVAGLQARLRRDIENARVLAALVEATPGWTVVAPVHLQTVCIRHQPDGLSGEALDAYTRAWAEAVNRSGEAYLTPATLDDRWMVRMSVGAPETEREDVEAVWECIRRHAAATLEALTA
jgi:aromatic-L-amino-acid decarboxylase